MEGPDSKSQFTCHGFKVVCSSCARRGARTQRHSLQSFGFGKIQGREVSRESPPMDEKNGRIERAAVLKVGHRDDRIPYLLIFQRWPNISDWSFIISEREARHKKSKGCRDEVLSGTAQVGSLSCFRQLFLSEVLHVHMVSSSFPLH